MNKHRVTPLLMAISLVLGVVIGTFYASHYSGNRLNIINTGSNKLNYLLQLIDNNYVDTVIQLPDNLFFGVTIAVCIIVLKKNKSEAKTYFIDASQEFIHEGNKNKLSDDNIKRIHEAFAGKQDEEHFTKLIDNTVIAANDYNLSVSSYVEKADEKEAVDIDALNQEIERIVKREIELRTAIDAIIKELSL